MSNTDHWINDGQVFVTEGKAYGVTKKGITVCLGEEKDVIKNSNSESPQERESKAQFNRNPRRKRGRR